MKRMMALVLGLALVLTAALGCSEQTESFFAQFEGMEWNCCLGIGGWSTDIRILPDGSFTGEYHNSEIGENGEGYPDGTVYYSSFTGRMTVLEQVDEYSWKILLDEVTLDEVENQEEIIDGIRFVWTENIGLGTGDEMTLYRPGTPTDGFTDDMKMWNHFFDIEEVPGELPDWFLYCEDRESGFVGTMPIHYEDANG